MKKETYQVLKGLIVAEICIPVLFIWLTLNCMNWAGKQACSGRNWIEDNLSFKYGIIISVIAWVFIIWLIF
jgi:hypothetical protein